MTTRTTAQSPPDSEYQPTFIERRLYRALTVLGIRYLPQHEIGWYRLDAYLPDHNLAVEVDGCFYHGCLACGYDTPHDQAARLRDHVRNRRLLVYHGIRTIRIWGHAMPDEDAALASVCAALRQAGVMPGATREEHR